MACLLALLRDAGQDLQPRLQSQLSGVFGGIVRQYLPQSWVFVTESETVTLTVDREGRFGALPGRSDAPDVTVETTHDRLAAALRTRQRDQVPPGPFRAIPHTEKGRTAYGLLRQRLGL